jgi:hypothetical protein
MNKLVYTEINFFFKKLIDLESILGLHRKLKFGVIKVKDDFYDLQNEKAEMIIEKLYKDLETIKVIKLIDKDNEYSMIVNYSEELTLLSLSFDEIAPNEAAKYFYREDLMNNKFLESGMIRHNFQKGGNYTNDVLAEEGIRTTANKFGFNFYWCMILGSDELKQEIPVSEEIILNAPVFEAKKLPSGSIFLRITENFDKDKYDDNYYNAYKKLYEYFLNNLDK